MGKDEEHIIVLRAVEEYLKAKGFAVLDASTMNTSLLGLHVYPDERCAWYGINLVSVNFVPTDDIQATRPGERPWSVSLYDPDCFDKLATIICEAHERTWKSGVWTPP